MTINSEEKRGVRERRKGNCADKEIGVKRASERERANRDGLNHEHVWSRILVHNEKNGKKKIDVGFRRWVSDIFYENLERNVQPNRPFHSFKASKSRQPSILYITGSSCDGF